MTVVSQNYIDQTLDELRLLVAFGTFKKQGSQILVNEDKTSVLTVHKYSSFSYGDFTFDIYILGESHAVLVKYKGRIILYEIIACTDIQIKNVESLFLKDLNDHVQHETKVGDCVHVFTKKYMNSTQLDEMCKYLEKVSQYANNNTTKLEHNFCTNDPCDCLIKPITMVVVEVDGDGVNIHSIHVYPNEEDKKRMAVYTKTTIRKP
ncbi:MAG: DUF2617 family protein [Candidatus Paceibacterota bacterium]